jgi:hypothetical protein
VKNSFCVVSEDDHTHTHTHTHMYGLNGTSSLHLTCVDSCGQLVGIILAQVVMQFYKLHNRTSVEYVSVL